MKNKKSLLETHPNVAAQWHPTKNGDLKHISSIFIGYSIFLLIFVYLFTAN